MKANEFLKFSGEHYNEMRSKWSARLKKQGLRFSEDTFQDTILKVYDVLQKHEIADNDIEGFWYKSFLINTKRDMEYSCNSKRDSDIDPIDYLKDFPAEDRGIMLCDVEDKIKSLNEIDKHLLLIYYLTDITYEELEELTGIKDIRYKLKKIIKKLRVVN